MVPLFLKLKQCTAQNATARCPIWSTKRLENKWTCLPSDAHISEVRVSLSFAYGSCPVFPDNRDTPAGSPAPESQGWDWTVWLFPSTFLLELTAPKCTLAGAAHDLLLFPEVRSSETYLLKMGMGLPSPSFLIFPLC